MYICDVGRKQQTSTKEWKMQTFKLGAVKYRSRARAVVALAKNTKLTNRAIAQKVGVSDATVSATLKNEFLKLTA